MNWDRKDRTNAGLWFLAGGIALGLTVAFILGKRARKRRVSIPPNLLKLEDAVVDALRDDQILRKRFIEVAAIAPGIIELTGTVDSEAEGHQTVAVAQNVEGVRTVLNRLAAVDEERRFRQRSKPSLDTTAGSRWYGMNVGMGRRRQSPTTDPAQRDDRADLVEQALAPDAETALTDLAQERVEKRAKRANEVS